MLGSEGVETGLEFMESESSIKSKQYFIWQREMPVVE
jgi:hypothetical protein